MSFGSETGRTRSSSKGFSNRTKKQKRKKQEFHAHRRARFQETEQPDPDQLRARTILMLDRLGHQVLSSEPGGYDLEDWTRNLNSLLDDFQERVGAERITVTFREVRQTALLPLTQPSSTSGDLDAEIERLVKEELAAREAREELGRKRAAKLASLREERDSCEGELKVAKDRLASLVASRQSRTFFSRWMGGGGGGAETQAAEAKVADLEAKLKALQEEIDKPRKVRPSAGEGDNQKKEKKEDEGSSTNKVMIMMMEGDPAELEILLKLEAAQKRLGELQAAKRDALQLTRERETATKALSEVISLLDLGPSNEQGEAQKGTEIIS